MGFYFKVRSAKTFPKATWSARKGKAVVLVSLARVGRLSKKARPTVQYERDQVLFAVGVP